MKNLSTKNKILILLVLINSMMIGSVAYATVSIISPASDNWCGPNTPGCGKEMTAQLTNDPEAMSCPEPPATAGVGTTGTSGGSTTGDTGS